MAAQHPYPRSSPSLRHLAPTAVPVKGRDVWRGLGGISRPEQALVRLRSEVMQRTGMATCYLLGSARASLAVGLLALKRLSDRAKVIVPAYSCPTVVQSVLRAGLQPVFCDLSVATLDLDLAMLQQLMDNDVLAIVATHLYGLAQDIDDLLRLGQAYGAFIVEDAAQAFGATFRGRMVGTRGDVGIYSMGRGKCIPAGHGGLLVAQEPYAGVLDDVIREVVEGGGPRDLKAVALFAGYGIATSPVGWWFVAHSPLNPAGDGMNYSELPPVRLQRLSSGHAALGVSILERLPAIQEKQREHARRLMAALRAVDAVTLPHIPEGAEPVFLRLPIVLQSEMQARVVYDQLWQEGIGVSRSYLRTLPDMCADVCPTDGYDFPGAAHLATALLTLPTHGYLREADVQRIIHTFKVINDQGG